MPIVNKPSAGGGAQPFSGVSLQKNADQAGLAFNSQIDVTWQVEDYDTDGYITAPGTSVTIPATAYYLVEARVLGFDVTGVNAQLYIRVKVNGAQVRATEWRYDGGENEFAGECVCVLKLTAADTVKITASLSGSGGTTWQINGAGDPDTHFTVTKLGAVA